MLFTGDASVTSLKSTLNNLSKDVSVFKVPHHGANGVVDKGIVSYLNPKVSLISVGENKFGYPSLLTLEYLKSSKILRTDVNNSIKIIATPKSYKFFEYDLKKKKYVPVF